MHTTTIVNEKQKLETMMKLTVLASLLSCAAAFAPQQVSKTTTALNADKMPAMPFLPATEGLKGYIGDDIGFDPLKISDYFPMDYLRESELKHGRICMSAAVGFMVVDNGLVLHPLGQGLSSLQAHDVMVENGVMGNMLVFLGLLEMVGYLAVAEMLQGSGREPGDFGLGTRFLKGKTEEQINYTKYQEIMNGRLAMLACGGMMTQSALHPEIGFPYF